MEREQIGRMILEASTGMHGDMARDVAQAWCSLAEKMQELQSKVDDLNKENSSLKKDAARLDWIEKECAGKVFRPYTSNTDFVKFEWNNDDGDLRAAIDTATQKD